MPNNGWLHTYLRQVEAEAIEATLRRTEGNIAQASRELGVSRMALYKRLRTLGIERRGRRLERLAWPCAICHAAPGETCTFLSSGAPRPPHWARRPPDAPAAAAPRPGRLSNVIVDPNLEG